MDLIENKLIVALDVETDKEAYKIVDLLKSKVKIFKIGFRLFLKYGPEVVRKVIKKDCKVFLDLKFHDIPNTVANAVESISSLGVYMFNVHSLGGADMMKSAVSASNNASLKLSIPKPIVLGVTVLTSIDQKILVEDMGIRKGIGEHVAHLARKAKESGLDGVVASALEIGIIRRTCGDDFIIVTPGIRLAEQEQSSTDDQRRILTPFEAVRRGADLIVVGRPIIKAEKPLEVASKIIEEIKAALDVRSRQKRRAMGIVTHGVNQQTNQDSYREQRNRRFGFHRREEGKRKFFRKYQGNRKANENAQTK